LYDVIYKLLRSLCCSALCLKEQKPRRLLDSREFITVQLLLYWYFLFIFNS